MTNNRVGVTNIPSPFLGKFGRCLVVCKREQATSFSILRPGRKLESSKARKVRDVWLADTESRLTWLVKCGIKNMPPLRSPRDNL